MPVKPQSANVASVGGLELAAEGSAPAPDFLDERIGDRVLAAAASHDDVCGISSSTTGWISSMRTTRPITTL